MVQDQEELIQAVHQSVAPIIKGKPHLQVFCSDACVLRFLRARGMNASQASAMLTAALEWCAASYM